MKGRNCHIGDQSNNNQQKAGMDILTLGNTSKKKAGSRAWRWVPEFQLFRKLRDKGHEFKVSLCNTARSLSKKRKKKKRQPEIQY
jgi:hypothetical protein